MKRTIFALAATLLLGCLSMNALAQETRQDGTGNPDRVEVGESLPPGSYGRSAAVANPDLVGLRAAPPGYSWHRRGNNYYLVDLGSGCVSDAAYDVRTD